MATLLSTKGVGYINVYDIEVKHTHNFMVSGICVHNSSSKPNF